MIDNNKFEGQGQGIFDGRAIAQIAENEANKALDDVPEIVSQVTPRYRGKTDFLDNTGTVGGNVMNLGDRILYTGSQEGLTTNRVYRWLGDGWELLSPPTELNRQNAWYYLEANGDVTEGAPEAVFSFAQIASLVTSAIFSQFVGAVDIELIEKIVNGVVKQGSIRSSDFQTGQSGFRIKYNGDAEFNKAIFRGHIEAGSGTFKGDIITEAFQVIPSSQITFNTSGYTASSFFQYVESRLGSIPLGLTLYPSSGSYNGIGIRYVYIYRGVQALTISINLLNNTEYSWSGNQALPEFSFVVGATNRTIKMFLPDSAVNSGELYRVRDSDGNYTVKIKG